MYFSVNSRVRNNYSKIYHTEERYKISIPVAGQDGYGKIDKATDTFLERDVAIKTLDPIFRDIEQSDIERFKREAKVLAAVSHSNIPAIYDVIFKPEQTEFKMIYAWIEGLTLNRHLMEAGTLSLEDVRRCFGNICSLSGILYFDFSINKERGLTLLIKCNRQYLSDRKGFLVL